MSEHHPATGDEDQERDHPELADLEKEATVRISVDGESMIGEVDDVRHSREGAIVSHAVTVIEDGYQGSLWDLETQYDPRTGWNDVTGHERIYDDGPTSFETHETVTVERIERGVDPDAVEPGQTIKTADGDEYRVVVPPQEREYDSKILAYNLDSSGNACEKVKPADVATLETEGEQGLYNKFEVYRDGTPVDGFVFVLKPESDEAAREALWEYANETDNEELSEDLKTRLLETVGTAEESDRDD